MSLEKYKNRIQVIFNELDPLSHPHYPLAQNFFMVIGIFWVEDNLVKTEKYTASVQEKSDELANKLITDMENNLKELRGVGH